MTRHNLCTNPCLSVANTGWGGASTPARSTGLTGFPDRSTGASYTTGTFLRSAAGAVTVGQQYTISAYVRSNNFNGSGTAYLQWVNGSGSDLTPTTASYSLTAGVVTRVSVTGTAPANAATAGLILDGINYAVSSVDITELLLEQAATALGYFDGDSPQASWDGTAGLSASTLNDVVTGSASLSGSGTLTASGVATAYGSTALTGTGTLTAAGTATAYGTAALTAAGTMTAAGTATAYGTVALSGSGRLTVAPPSIDVHAVTIGPAERGWAYGTAQRSWAIGPAEV